MTNKDMFEWDENKNQIIRLISARKANKNETNLYWRERNESIY